MEKKIPVWFLVLIIFFGLLSMVIFGWMVQNTEKGYNRFGVAGTIASEIAGFPSLVKKVFTENTDPLIIDNRFPEIDGFKKQGKVQIGAINDQGYLLLSAYSAEKKQTTVKLIRIKDQKILFEWVADTDDIANRLIDKTPLINEIYLQKNRFRMTHPLLLDDGGLIFNLAGGPLIKINKCSKVEFQLNQFFHHGIEKDHQGNIWVPLSLEPSTYTGTLLDNYQDDAIAKVSVDGKIIFTKSVTDILLENGYQGLIYGVGRYDQDAIHLNDIQPALFSGKYWQKGDLLLSLRNRSTVLLYRPESNKVIWLKTGPWLNQHDPNFVGKNKISIFGNDVMFYPKTGLIKLVNGSNDVYLYNFEDNSIKQPYTKLLKEKRVQTLEEGRQKILANGDVFIEETNHGRLLRLSAQQIIWEYSPKISEKTTGLLSWSRYLTLEQIKDILPVLENSNCL